MTIWPVVGSPFTLAMTSRDSGYHCHQCSTVIKLGDQRMILESLLVLMIDLVALITPVPEAPLRLLSVRPERPINPMIAESANATAITL